MYQPVTKEFAKTYIALKKPIFYMTKTGKVKKAGLEEVYHQSLKYLKLQEPRQPSFFSQL